MLRSSIDLQTQLKQSHQKLESLSQQLSSSPADGEEEGIAFGSVPGPSRGQGSVPGVAKTGNGDAKALPGTGHASPKKTAALMERLLGSDDDEDDSEEDVQKAVPAQEASALSVAGQSVSKAGKAADAPVHGVTDKQVTASTKSAGMTTESDRGIGSSQLPAASSSLGQRVVDPAAPKRSITFNNSIRRRQSSSAKQRRDMFNEAADAAISQALSQRNAVAAATQASDLASESAQDAAVVEPEADVSTHVTPVSISQQPNHVSHATAAVQPQQSTHATAADQMQRSSSTQDLPTGRTQSAQGSANPTGVKQSKAEKEQEAPRLITWTVQAEVAPKLKMGSRLAASMAKLATLNKAGNAQADVVAPAVAAAPVQPKGDGKKSAIPEDVKRALLAKVQHWCMCTLPLCSACQSV